jgi:hypothetical protein
LKLKLKLKAASWLKPTEHKCMHLAEKNLNRVDPAIFDTALYMICIGGNDIVQPLFQGILPEALIENAIPNIVHDVENAVRVFELILTCRSSERFCCQFFRIYCVETLGHNVTESGLNGN